MEIDDEDNNEDNQILSKPSQNQIESHKQIRSRNQDDDEEDQPATKRLKKGYNLY